MANHTIKLILQNFEEMLIEMPFSKMTVSALVERCEISSNTFYYHFQDIYELLDRWITVKVDKYIILNDVSRDWTKCLKDILKAMQRNPKMIYHIWDAISKERLEHFVFGFVQDWFYRETQRRLKDTEVSDYFMQGIAGFYCYTILGFVLKFLWDRMTADVDQAVDRLSSIFKGVSDYMVSKEANAFG